MPVKIYLYKKKIIILNLQIEFKSYVNYCWQICNNPQTIIYNFAKQQINYNLHVDVII